MGLPRVFRMPNNGAGDNDITDDEYVGCIIRWLWKWCPFNWI